MQACGPIHLKGAAYSHSTHTHRYSKLTLPSLCASLYCRVSKQHGEVIGRRLAASHAMLAEARAAAEAPAARMPPPLLKRHHTVSQKPQSQAHTHAAAPCRWSRSSFSAAYPKGGDGGSLVSRVRDDDARQVEGESPRWAWQNMGNRRKSCHS